MANQKNFAITPSVSISRSKFRRPSQHKTTFNLGDIVPIYCDEILPGDTVSMDLSALIRMSTPVAPIMDNIYVDYYAFFVPNRLVWSDWKKFMGENDSSYGAVTTEPTFPVVSIGDTGKRITPGCLGDYLGLPTITGAYQAQYEVFVSALPGRSYLLCYNEWFRDQNLIPPYSIMLSSTARLGSDPVSSTNLFYNMSLLKAAKESDYFTRALPYAQKGAPVKLPLGSTADIMMKTPSLASGQTAGLAFVAGGDTYDRNLSTDGLRLSYTSNPGTVQGDVKLYADLQNATAATINQLRFSFQYQKFLEKDALFGSRYWEVLKGHFGITAPDASLQRPELLGHFRQRINIDQVLQTTGHDVSAPANNELGDVGANSVSGKSEHLISKSFVEHGTLLILAVARHDQTYGQGINRMWSRLHRTDFYFPVFANLGAQEIKNKEIFANNDANDNGTFGFQEAWAEYRYKPSICSGLISPNRSGSLGFWTLANNFASLPTLSRSFIEQDRNALGRTLVTTTTGPDFIADFYFDAVYVRPMPMYSLPGLIDHH